MNKDVYIGTLKRGEIAQGKLSPGKYVRGECPDPRQTYDLFAQFKTLNHAGHNPVATKR